MRIDWGRPLAGGLLVLWFTVLGAAPGLWLGSLVALGGAALGATAGCYAVRWIIAGSGGDLFHYPSEYGGR